MVRFSKDKETKEIDTKYPPRFKVTLTTSEKNGERVFDCAFFDKNRKRIEGVSPDPNSENCVSKLIPQGSKCIILVQSKSSWVSPTGFGNTWKAVQVRISPPFGMSKDAPCCLSDPEDDEETAGAPQKDKVPSKTAKEVKASPKSKDKKKHKVEQVSDSDVSDPDPSDSDSSSESDSEPETKKKKKKSSK